MARKREEPKLPTGWTWSWRKGGEALCPHGVGHDYGVHGCDGCCAALPAGTLEGRDAL